MFRMLGLILADTFGGLKGISKKDILLSPEYQYAAREAARIEDERNSHAEENRQLQPLAQEYERMVEVLGNYLMTASPEWAKMTPAEKLKAHLEGNSNLIRIERENARAARENVTKMSEKTQREIESMQGLIKDIKKGTVPREILETIIQKVPKATLILNPNFEITHYNASAKSHPHFELAKGMDYKELFSTTQGFNAFRYEMQELREGQSFQGYTQLGNRGDYISNASPITERGRSFGWHVSIRPETKIEWAKRKFLLTKELIAGTELETDILPEQA